MFKEDIRSREMVLRSKLDREKGIKYDELPSEIQLAVFDMAYNLGISKLLRDFPSFLSAIKEEDYMKAAKQCNRLGIPAKRNQITKELLKKAATIAILKSIRGGPYSSQMR